MTRPYRTWVNSEAKAEIRQLPGHIRQRIRKVIQDFGIEPRPHFSQPLKTPQEMNVEVRRARIDH